MNRHATETPGGPGRRWLEERRLAYILLLIAPALFASNMLTAKAVADSIPPVALAFWRWTTTCAILLPLVGRTLWYSRAALRAEWLDLLVLGALGMGVCGAFVYIGADTTTAINIGLIYAASPILIVLMARVFWRESLSPLQGLGVAISLAGVVVVISQGQAALLLDLDFTTGDLWIVAATTGWALYSVLLRYRPSRLGLMPRFAVIALGGVAVLLPFAFWEGLTDGWPRLDGTTAITVLFLACVASFGAYLAYARVQKVLGAGPTSLIMYLIPLYNGVLAYLLLGETLEFYHLIGAALVFPGLYLTTRRP